MSSSIDEQFIDYIVKSLVSNPDAVKIERTIDEKGVLLELTVDPEDLGRVIGKRGATAQSLRTLLRALGTKNDARYNLKIVDNGVPKPKDDSRDDKPKASKKPEAVPTEAVAESQDLDLDDDDEEAETKSESTLSKTRKELDDLDDLDI